MMRLLIVAAILMLLLPALLHAGQRMDYINTLEPADYCEVVADQFYAGALGRLYGSVRELKASTPAIIESLEHGLPLPKDGLYVLDWDKLDAIERAFVARHVLGGYDRATPDMDETQVLALAQAHYDACMESRKTHKRTDVGRFIRAEALENVAPAKRLAQCTEWLADYKFIGLAVKHGRDCDQMQDWTRDTEGVQDERRAKIARILDQVCALPRDAIDAWFGELAKTCMGP